MGRSKYNYIPRSYVLYPLVCPDNLGAGEDPETALVHLPVDVMRQTGITPSTNRLAAPVLGAMISVADNTVFDTTLDVDVEDATESCLNNAHSFAAGDVGNVIGKLGYDGDAGATWLATKIGGATGQSVKLVCTAGASDTFIDPALTMILSPGRLVDGSENELDPDDKTHARGPVAGTLVTIPLQEVDLADEQADIALREITMPFGVRVQKVITSTATSNTGTQVYVRNDTQSQNIIQPGNVMNSATPVSESHEPGGNLIEAGRDIARGDVIQLWGATDAGEDTGGMTRVAAIIVGHVTDHITSDGTRLIPYDGTTWPSSHEKVTTEMSGPVAGGLATLYLAGNDLAQGEAETLTAACKVPFDCEVLHVQFQSYASGVGNTARIAINAAATEIVPETAIIGASQSAIVATSFTNANLSVGDNLELLLDTSADNAAITSCGATVLVRVTGFPHTDPLND